MSTSDTMLLNNNEHLWFIPNIKGKGSTFHHQICDRKSKAHLTLLTENGGVRISLLCPRKEFGKGLTWQFVSDSRGFSWSG